MDINQLLMEASQKGSSDIHITVGRPPMVRQSGKMIPLGDYPTLTPEDTKKLTLDIVKSEKLELLEREGDVDLPYAIKGVGRFRVNVYKQRGSYTLAIRVLVSQIPTLEQLGLPNSIKEMANKPRGLVLVTGPTGSGKSTTLAAMVNHINQTKSGHIITIEDPVEYLHKHQQCIIHQREIGDDVNSFQRALRASLRQDPDVILLGEMRDLETIQAAITAAETGHLVLSTLHTKGAANTVDRIIDSYPPNQQRQIRVQLANVLEGIITQNLVPRADKKGRVLAMEILVMNDAIRHMIRDEKTHQIASAMQMGGHQGMQSMEHHLASLVKRNMITLEDALAQATKQDELMRYIKLNP